MTGIRHRFLMAIGLAGTIALGGCYDDGYYGGVSVGSGYYGGGYYDPYYSPGYYPGGYGWYDGFYYPGNGYYVYDRGGRRHRWNDGQRRYWEGRRGPQGQDGRWNGRDRDRPDRNRPAWSRPGRDQAGQDQAGQGRPDGWRGGDGRPDRNGRPGAWTRPRPDGNVARPAPQPRPQVNQPRSQRSWEGRSMPAPRADRPMRSGGGRDPATRTRPR